MTILLWGPASDPPLQAVYAELYQQGIPTFLLDQERVLQTQFQWTVGTSMEACIQMGEQFLNLSAVTAVYLRAHDSCQTSALAAAELGSTAWNHAIALDRALTAWAELAPGLTLNRPSAMAANHSKPYQMEQIRRSGFGVPHTLLTTDPEAALAFWEQYGEVIYKSISGVRSQVSRLTAEHRDRLAHLTWCPTQFQQYIPGCDYRVHVVGTQLFACEIVSQADDYRYAAEAEEVPVLRSVQLPDAVQQRCQLLAAELNLPVAGIDLRQTPEGEWYCFEVNPSPGFTYFQHETGQPISAAIAHLLANPQQPFSPPSRPSLVPSPMANSMAAPVADPSPATFPFMSPPLSPSCTPVMAPTFHLTPLSFSWVALHPQPKGVIQFIGGAFFGTLPTVFYRYLLRQLFEDGYTIVAFPFRFSFRHWSIAGSLFNEQTRLRSLLTQEANRLGYESALYSEADRYSWLGHSLGCKYIALLEFLSDPNWRSLLQTYLGVEEAARIERSLHDAAPGQDISIKGQASLLLAPNIGDTQSAIPIRSLANLLDRWMLGVLPTRRQAQTLIDQSRLFNLTALISFDRDKVAGSQRQPTPTPPPLADNDVVWFVEQLRQKAFPLLTQEFAGKHLEPMSISLGAASWNPFGKVKTCLALRFLDQGVRDFLKELRNRRGDRS